jgi:hypothetical protein
LRIIVGIVACLQTAEARFPSITTVQIPLLSLTFTLMERVSAACLRDGKVLLYYSCAVQ